jgi:hypothetical protein
MNIPLQILQQDIIEYIFVCGVRAPASYIVNRFCSP